MNNKNLVSKIFILGSFVMLMLKTVELQVLSNSKDISNKIKINPEKSKANSKNFTKIFEKETKLENKMKENHLKLQRSDQIKLRHRRNVPNDIIRFDEPKIWISRLSNTSNITKNSDSQKWPYNKRYGINRRNSDTNSNKEINFNLEKNTNSEILNNRTKKILVADIDMQKPKLGVAVDPGNLCSFCLCNTKETIIRCSYDPNEPGSKHILQLNSENVPENIEVLHLNNFDSLHVEPMTFSSKDSALKSIIFENIKNVGLEQNSFFFSEHYSESNQKVEIIFLHCKIPRLPTQAFTQNVTHQHGNIFRKSNTRYLSLEYHKCDIGEIETNALSKALITQLKIMDSTIEKLGYKSIDLDVYEITKFSGSTLPELPAESICLHSKTSVFVDNNFYELGNQSLQITAEGQVLFEKNKIENLRTGAFLGIIPSDQRYGSILTIKNNEIKNAENSSLIINQNFPAYQIIENSFNIECQCNVSEEFKKITGVYDDFGKDNEENKRINNRANENDSGEFHHNHNLENHENIFKKKRKKRENANEAEEINVNNSKNKINIKLFEKHEQGHDNEANVDYIEGRSNFGGSIWAKESQNPYDLNAYNIIFRASKCLQKDNSHIVIHKYLNKECAPFPVLLVSAVTASILLFLLLVCVCVGCSLKMKSVKDEANTFGECSSQSFSTLNKHCSEAQGEYPYDERQQSQHFAILPWGVAVPEIKTYQQNQLADFNEQTESIAGTAGRGSHLSQLTRLLTLEKSTDRYSSPLN